MSCFGTVTLFLFMISLTLRTQVISVCHMLSETGEKWGATVSVDVADVICPKLNHKIEGTFPLLQLWPHTRPVTRGGSLGAYEPPPASTYMSFLHSSDCVG